MFTSQTLLDGPSPHCSQSGPVDDAAHEDTAWMHTKSQLHSRTLTDSQNGHEKEAPLQYMRREPVVRLASQRTLKIDPVSLSHLGKTFPDQPTHVNAVAVALDKCDINAGRDARQKPS